MIIGFAKSAMDSIKVTRKAFPRPGRRRGRIDVLQKALEHHVADREECQCLYDNDAPETVDRVVIYVEKVSCDDAGRTEQHDHGKGQNKGR